MEPPSWRLRWNPWRDANATLEVCVLTVNHIRALDAAALAITPLGPTVDEAGLAFRREPIFWLKPEHIVLPAFALFAGGFEITRSDRADCIACVETELVASFLPLGK